MHTIEHDSKEAQFTKQRFESRTSLHEFRHLSSNDLISGHDHIITLKLLKIRLSFSSMINIHAHTPRFDVLFYLFFPIANGTQWANEQCCLDWRDQIFVGTN